MLLGGGLHASVGGGRVLFDVSDVHRETSQVARGLARQPLERSVSPRARAVRPKRAAAPAADADGDAAPPDASPDAGTFV